MKNFFTLILFAVCIHLSARAQNTCNGVWGQMLVNQTFGQGNATDTWYGPLTTFAPGASTSTIFVGAAGPPGGVLVDNFSGLVKIPTASGQGGWVSTPDHTGNTNGLMFVINAPSTAATVFFEYIMDDLCPNTTLKLSVWILNTNTSSLTTNPTYQYPNMTLNAIDAVTNTVLGTATSGNIPADEAWHQYSIIFNNGASTSIKLQLVNNSVGSGYGNDLAIDDITVQPCVPESHILPKMDTTICQNTLLNFSANVIASPYSPAEYQWQYSADNGTTWLDQGAPGTNTNYAFNTSALVPGTYWIRFETGPQGLTGNYNCVAVSDTSIIQVAEFPRDTINESVCLGTVYNFYGRYLGLAGTYDTLVRENPADLCGTLVTLHLTVIPLPYVDIDGAHAIDLCTGDTTLLRIVNPSAGATYQWLKDGIPIPGETGPQYRVTSEGLYSIAGDVQGCPASGLGVQVTERALPQASIIYDGQLLCTYDTLDFRAEKQVPGSFYLWSPEKAFRNISGTEGEAVQGNFTEQEMVYLKVYSPYGCSAMDSVLALVQPCCQALVPTAFSPNGDALNDYFNPVLKPGQLILALKVFDRYGKLVYNHENVKKGWNGNYKNGTPANAGVYMYLIKYTCSDQKIYELKGDLTLIR
jgi:gliding motility-associated-like protein